MRCYIYIQYIHTRTHTNARLKNPSQFLTAGGKIPMSQCNDGYTSFCIFTAVIIRKHLQLLTTWKFLYTGQCMYSIKIVLVTLTLRVRSVNRHLISEETQTSCDGNLFQWVHFKWMRVTQEMQSIQSLDWHPRPHGCGVGGKGFAEGNSRL